MSNSQEVLSKIPDADRVKPTLDLDLENLPVERTLGVQWDVEKDAFLFKVREPHKPPTKRGILSAVSSLYDPMGFVCPVVLEANAVFRLERATEVLELTYLGKYFACVNAN